MVTFVVASLLIAALSFVGIYAEQQRDRAEQMNRYLRTERDALERKIAELRTCNCRRSTLYDATVEVAGREAMRVRP